MAQVAPVGSVTGGIGGADAPLRNGATSSPIVAPGKLPPISGSPGALKSGSKIATAGEGATIQTKFGLAQPKVPLGSGFASKPVMPSIGSAATLHVAQGAVGAGDAKEALVKRSDVDNSAAPKAGEGSVLVMSESLAKVSKRAERALANIASLLHREPQQRNDSMLDC